MTKARSGLTAAADSESGFLYFFRAAFTAVR